MPLPSQNTFKKENMETESNLAQAADSKENPQAKQEDIQTKKKDGHGEDFCCGSCS